MNLDTCRLMSANKWVECKLTPSVLSNIEHLAELEQQPLMFDGPTLYYVFCYCDLIFAECCSAIVIAEGTDGDERSGREGSKDVALLCLCGEGWCERYRHTMCWSHFVAICGKYCGGVVCRYYVCACVDVVGANIMSLGACVGNDMWLWWDYGR